MGAPPRVYTIQFPHYLRCVAHVWLGPLLHVKTAGDVLLQGVDEAGMVMWTARWIPGSELPEGYVADEEPLRTEATWADVVKKDLQRLAPPSARSRGGARGR